ncbi:MAG TPA: HAD-IC family P-type ATPase, partial [Kofleriaceae bacterium]|nr:HAD-IC family P-type ATPase [Kofleriaceae bacterium]
MSSNGGLTTAEARQRLTRDGANEVADAPRHPWLRFGKKFWGVSAWMLELIAALSWILHKHADLVVALGLLVVNAILSFVQEERASAAVAALRKQLQVSARVLRDGAWHSIAARELVVGDVARVRSGDIIPADIELADGDLQIDESALTGESRATGAHAGATVHAGSIVRQGEATGTVKATGARTFFGRTTQLVSTA